VLAHAAFRNGAHFSNVTADPTNAEALTFAEGSDVS
jgi:hypothetical protein